jgi:hypothetical protein
MPSAFAIEGRPGPTRITCTPHQRTRKPPGGASALVSPAVPSYKIRMVGPTWFQQIVSVAGGILTIAACIAMIGAIALAVVLAGTVRRAQAKLLALEGVAPLLIEIRRLIRNLDGVITALREDVVAVRETVVAANTGAREVVRKVEDRVRRLDALVDVVQEEVEEALVSAAATARGARVGVSAIGKLMGGWDRSGDEPGSRAPSVRRGSGMRGDPDDVGPQIMDSEGEEAGDANEWRGEGRAGRRRGGPTGTGGADRGARPRRRGR